MAPRTQQHAPRFYPRLAGRTHRSLLIQGLVLIWLGGCSATDFTIPPPSQPPSDSGSGGSTADAGQGSGSGTPIGTPTTPPPSPPQTPTVAFTSAPVFCCDPRSIVFEASTEGPKVPSGTQFRWEFGDGRTGEGQRVEHTYAWPGDYTVILKADFRDGTVRSADARLSLPSEPAPIDQPATPPLSPGDNPDTSQSPSVPVDSVVAVAGDDRMAQPGTWVVLDGSASFGTGNRALAYMWRQIGGQAVSIVNPTHSAATFLTPSDPQAPIVLEFELTVVQNGISNSDQVQIAVPCTKCQNDPGSTDNSGSTRNDDAIAQVLSGQLTTANASWWGFDPNDSTTAIQNAIWSGAKTVIIPDMGQDWVVRPLFLVSNQEIQLEPSVVVVAKPDAFHDPGDCLLTGDSITNVIIRGYGATLRMRKADYMTSDYSLSEFRHALSLKGVQGVQVLGLTLESSGGDGIFVGPSDGTRGLPCRSLTIRDCTCDDNYRQGMSVTSADGLTVDHCNFNGTIGTAPQAGVDLEPSDPSDKLINVEFTNCSASVNAGSGFMVNLSKLDSTSQPVSVHFSGCTVTNSRQPGLRALLATTGGQGGSVEFENCSCENTQYAGLMCKWNLDSPIALSFVNCQWNKVARYLDADLPIELNVSGGQTAATSGGIDFSNCLILDDRARDTVDVTGGSPGISFSTVTGEISVVNPQISVPVSKSPWPLPNLSLQLQHP